MSVLSKKEKQRLLRAHFLPREVFELDRAHGGDVRTGHRTSMNLATGSRPFKAMVNSRIKYVNDLHNAGWTLPEIHQKIGDYYKLRTGRSVFDFLKLSYRPPTRITNFDLAIHKKVRSRITRTLGKIYGRRLSQATKARTIPRRPVFPNRPRIIRRRYR